MSTTPTPVFVEYRTPSYFTYLDWFGFLTSADYRRQWYAGWRASQPGLPAFSAARCQQDQAYNNWHRCWADMGLNTPANIVLVADTLREVANRHGHNPDANYAGDETLVLNGTPTRIRKVWEVLPSKDSSGGILKIDRMVSVLMWKYTVARQRAKAVESVVGAKPSRQTNKRGTALRVVTVKLDESLLDPDVGITEQITLALRAYRAKTPVVTAESPKVAQEPVLPAPKALVEELTPEQWKARGDAALASLKAKRPMPRKLG